MGKIAAKVYDGERWVPIPVDPARKPIVVWCNHGVAAGANDFVQRYRWDVNQGKWIPSDSTGEGNTFIGPSGKRESNDPDGLMPGVPPDRQHYTARCKDCGRLVSMRENGAQVALTMLSDGGLTDPTMRVLQRAYDEVPPMLR
jgi:hypothetical protein